MCKRCFDQINIAYELKTRCLETNEFLIRSSYVDTGCVKVEPLDIQPIIFEPIAIKTELVWLDNSTGTKLTSRAKLKTKKVVGWVISLQAFHLLWSKIVLIFSSSKQRPITVLSKLVQLECDICGHQTYKRYLLNQHVQTHIPREFRERPYICEICGKRSQNLARLKAHILYLHKERELFYCHCGKSFKLESQMNLHVKELHEKMVEYPCTECGKIFFRRNNLSVHSRIHTAKDDFMCNVCGKLFGLHFHLQSHLKIHKKAFACEVPGCSKIFSHRRLLNMHHKNTHLNLKDYICSHTNCNKRFTSTQRLNRHIQISHEKLRKNCPVGKGCKYSVGRRDYMRNHLKRHSELSQADQAKYFEIIKTMKLVWRLQSTKIKEWWDYLRIVVEYSGQKVIKILPENNFNLGLGLGWQFSFK